MLKSNYHLELVRKKNEVYKSLIPKEISNLILLKGDTTFGKSKFLDIISAGMYGLKRNDLNEDLKKRIDHLMNPRRNKLRFDLIFENKSKSTILHIKKENINSQTIVVEEIKNGKSSRINEAVTEKYTLIYDIPHNPIKRIRELAKSIRDEQEFLISKLKRLNDGLERISREIGDSLDLKGLNEKKKEIEKMVKKIEANKKLRDNYTKLKKGLEMLIALRFSNKYATDLKRTSLEISRISKKIGGKGKGIKIERSINLKKNEIETSLENLESSIRDYASNLEKIFPKDKDISVLDRNFLSNCLESFEVPESLKILLNDFDEKVKEYEIKFKKTTDSEYYNFCEEMIKFLENYQDLNKNFLGKTIKEIIKDLNEKLESGRDDKDKRKILKGLIELNDIIFSKIKKTNLELGEFKKLVAKNPGMGNVVYIEGLVKQKEKFEKEKERIKSNKEIYEGRYASLGRPGLKDIQKILKNNFKKYATITSEQKLSESLESVKEKIDALGGDILIDEKDLKFSEDDYDRIKKKKPHKYKKYEKKIDNLHQITFNLESKFEQKYKVYIDNVITEKIVENMESDKKQRRYCELVSKFLASIVKSIPYQGKKFNLTEIDFAKGRLIFSNHNPIYFYDIGTATSGLALIKGSITNAIKKNKKMVVLLDEVGVMSENILQEIIDLLIEAYNKDLLLLGILVRPEKEKLVYKDLLNKNSDFITLAKRSKNKTTPLLKK